MILRVGGELARGAGCLACRLPQTARSPRADDAHRNLPVDGRSARRPQSVDDPGSLTTRLKTDMKASTAAMFGDWQRCWKRLFLTDVMYKVIAFVLLTPLVSILFSLALALSGNTVLADQDILIFFLAPAGWLCLIAVGGLALAIKALEMAALMVILAATPPRTVRPLEALRFASVHAVVVLKLTARMTGIVLLILAPFLLVAGGVYFWLLTDHDINFYLKEKPPVFQVALGCGAILLVVVAIILLRFFANWFFALPLVLFENVAPSRALRESRNRIAGHRRNVLTVLVVWLLVMTVLSGLATSLVIFGGRSLVPRMTGSLPALVFATGASLLVWWLVNLAINLLGTTSLAAILFHLYQRVGGGGAVEPVRPELIEISADSPWLRLTRRRLVAAGLIGGLVTILVGVWFARSVRLEDHTEIMAHRGASAAAPENTMAAIRQAIADGADWVEIDVQETADGEVVVFHDSDFMKLAGNPLKIWDATLPALQDIDIGSWFGAEFGDQRVPTLAAVLQECRGKIGVNIELKYYGHDQQLEQRVVDIVEACGMTENIVIMSLKLPAVEKMKTLRPAWRVGLLMSVAAGNLKNINADFLAVNASFVDRRFVQAAHKINKQVCVWTVNDPVSMSTMIGRGVDAVITDKPAVARLVLQQRSELSAPERLLVELAGIFGIEREVVGQ